MGDKTRPTAAEFDELVHAISYSYEAGQYPPVVHDTVAAILRQPDGGMLVLAEIAAEMAHEIEDYNRPMKAGK